MSVQIPLYGNRHKRRGGARPEDVIVVGHVIVDDCDAPLVATYRWNLASTGYAVTTGVFDGQRRHVYMHRLLMGLVYGDPRHVDHISRDPLDCRRENMRIVRAGQNGENKSGCRGSTSVYRGVSWHKGAGKWVATARAQGVSRHIGLFTDELDAARAAAQFRAEHMPFSVEDPALLSEAA